MSFDPDAMMRTVELLGVQPSVSAVASQVSREFRCSSRTVKRFIAGLEVLRLRHIGATDQENADAWNLYVSYQGREVGLQKLAHAYAYHYWIPEYRAKHQDHLTGLKSLIENLASIGVWAVDNYDLANFLMAGEVEWSFPGGKIVTGDDGLLEVRLEAELAEGWGYLQGRFSSLELWKAISNWKRCATEDVAARLSFLKATEEAIGTALQEAGDSIPLVRELGVGIPEQGLNFRFIFGIYSQALNRLLSGKARNLQLEQLSGASEDVRLEGHPAGFKVSEVQMDIANQLLLELPATLAKSAEARKAITGYRRAIKAVDGVMPGRAELLSRLD
jgi:hypothetical protein